jgi:hypothetical protein
MERIGKGKAHKPYEFGVKVSIVTTVSHSRGGQFIIHAKAAPGNPYGGRRGRPPGACRRLKTHASRTAE